MYRLFFVLICVICLFPLSTGAYTLLGSTNYGDIVQGHTAKSMALGASQAAVETGSAALFTNPAVLTRINSPRLEGSFGLTRYREVVSRKVFDSFESTIGDAAIAANSKTHGSPYLANVIIPLDRFGLSKRYVFSAGYTTLYDFNYEHEQIDRDSQYQITQTRHYQSEGSLDCFSAGMGIRAIPMLAVGFGVNVWTGENTVSYVLDDLNPNHVDSTYTQKYENLSGVNFSIGVLVQPLPVKQRLAIGLYAQTPAKISGDYRVLETNKESRDVTYPLRIGFGVDYMPQNPIVSRLVMDVVYNNRSKLDDTARPNLNLEDTIEFHVGMEHHLTDQTPVRLGFYWEPYDLDNDLASAYVTFGAGYRVQHFGVDVAAKLGKRNYRTGDVTYDPESANTTVFNQLEIENAEFEETHGQLMITVNYGF